MGTLALLLLLSPAIASCLSTQRIPFDNAVRLDRAVGVTTESGKEIRFSKRGAWIRNDTMYAVGRSGEVALPTDSIAQVAQQQASPRRSGLLMLGLIFAAVGCIALTPSPGIVGFP
jgi:hypothetical protein